MDIDRRTLLTLSSSYFISACASCPGDLRNPLLQGALGMGDAHAHFFNASDLPIEGFVRDVFLRQSAPRLSGTWSAIVDLLLNEVKKFAISVDRERDYLGLQPLDRNWGEPTPPEDYAKRISKRIEDEAAKADNQSDESASNSAIGFEELAESYRLLAFTLNAYSGENQDESADGRLSVSEDLILGLATEDEFRSVRYNRYPWATQMSESQLGRADPCDENDSDDNPNVDLKGILHLLSWGYLMLQSRCYHVRQYLKTIRSLSWQPKVVTNLLVDYDFWLRDENLAPDGPSDRSSHEKQIQFWADYSAKVKDEVRIATFAGYDPLKHADQLAEANVDHETEFQPGNSRSRYFATLSQQAVQGSISGFKLYPPMGFRPYGNSDPEVTFIGRDGVKDKVVRWWAQKHEGKPLGSYLDCALREFYSFAERGSAGRPLPIIAHAGRSNTTACNFTDRPSPQHWARALALFPELRISLGHFTHAPDFIEAMKSPEERAFEGELVWAVEYTQRLMAEFHGVHADLSYMEELLGRPMDEAQDPYSPKKFFTAVLRYCAQLDRMMGAAKVSNFGANRPSASQRLMFGSDWIMLGLEPGHSQYVGVMEQALDQAIQDFAFIDPEWAGLTEFKQNFFASNLNSFLE